MMKDFFMRFLRKWIFLLVFFCDHAIAQPLTLELQHANLADAIRLIARFIHLNVVISPSVKGEITLSVQNVNPRAALDLVLSSHGLVKVRKESVWFIAPRNELIKQQEEEKQWIVSSEEASPLMTEIWQIRYASAQQIGHLFQDNQTAFLSKRGSLRVDERTNSIFIQDIPERVQKADRVIKNLDKPVKQIAISARLVSVDNDFERDLGVDFTVKDTSSFSNESGKLSKDVPGRYSMAVVKLADGSLLDIQLAALENKGHAEVISRPSLLTANQQPASIEAGEEIPYQEVSESGGTAVAFKKAVLGLKVTPQVLPDNRVLLQLQINQDRPSRKMVLGVPTISTHQMTTNVLVRAGQTVVLGGIFELNHEESERRLPFISQLPVIGLLFKQENRRENKRELLIFVTPNIIA